MSAKESRELASRRWRQSNKEKSTEINKRNYENHRDAVLTRSKQFNIDNPKKRLLYSSRSSAKRRGMEHTICLDDIPNIPECCPLLGITLKLVGDKISDGTPSLDRIDNTKGYTPDNIWIISWRANRIKCDATWQELEMLVAALKHKVCNR